MTVGIGIRNATIADSEGIAQLVTDLGYRTSPGQMCKRLEAILHDEDYNTLVAWEDERIVGFIGTRLGPLYESDDRYGQIMALAVATDHRRRGVGRTLMQTAESILAQRGARVLVVTSGNHRADAHAFYEIHGYTWSGRRYKKPLVSSAEQPAAAPPSSSASRRRGESGTERQ
jgi:ribosomal protein S18 acetylase RimI-like enzyme